MPFLQHYPEVAGCRRYCQIEKRVIRWSYIYWKWHWLLNAKQRASIAYNDVSWFIQCLHFPSTYSNSTLRSQRMTHPGKNVVHANVKFCHTAKYWNPVRTVHTFSHGLDIEQIVSTKYSPNCQRQLYTVDQATFPDLLWAIGSSSENRFSHALNCWGCICFLFEMFWLAGSESAVWRLLLPAASPGSRRSGSLSSRPGTMFHVTIFRKFTLLEAF